MAVSLRSSKRRPRDDVMRFARDACKTIITHYDIVTVLADVTAVWHVRGRGGRRHAGRRRRVRPIRQCRFS